MKQQALLNDEQLKQLKQLNIQRNIKNVYDLEALLFITFEQQNVKYLLQLETVKVPCSRKTITQKQLEKINTFGSDERIYHRYSYTAGSQYIGSDDWHKSKIDAILSILKTWLWFNVENKARYNILNHAVFSEYFNAKQKYFKLDKYRNDSSIDRLFGYLYQRSISFQTYSVTHAIIEYQFVDEKNKVYEAFLHYTDYKRFNLYLLSQRHLNRALVDILKSYEIKFEHLKTEDVDVYFCTSGMNIYYIELSELNYLKLNELC